MTTLEILDEKLLTLRETLDKLKNVKLDNQTTLQAQLVIILECEKLLDNEDLISDYDFKKSLELITSYGYNIDDLEKIILDIQNAILIRKELNLSKDELPLDDNQVLRFKEFINSLKEVRESINEKLEIMTTSTDNERKIKNLEQLRKVLNDDEKHDYVTYDMFSDFYEEFDILGLPYEQLSDLLEPFYQTKNLDNSLMKIVDFNDVLNLYKEFLSTNYMVLFEKMLKEHQNEIVNTIDLDNTRKILQFFNEKDILENFQRTALLKISLFGNFEYIKNVVYPKIMQNKPDDIEVYYQDELATVWIKENGINNYRIKQFRSSRGESSGKDEESLFTSCHSVDYDEFWQNIELLKQNQRLFDEKQDLNDLGANLKLKTLPTWLLKKNIELCKLFNLGSVIPVSMSCLERGDVEDKIHLAIELGLLNSPMTPYFLEIDKGIVRNDEFQRNVLKKNLTNQSIRNYFQRYSSMISNKSINEYAYLFYKLIVNGYSNFYDEFFSSNQAGKASGEILGDFEKQILSDKNKMEHFIEENFALNWYSEYIKKYDEFDSVILYHDDVDKKEHFSQDSYFDEDILNDELIKKLEDNNSVMDNLIQDGQIIEQKNQYCYLFGNRIISRYKVLHNASILKKRYGVLTKDMLLTSIVRNSFLDFDSLKKIYNEIIERNKSL